MQKSFKKKVTDHPLFSRLIESYQQSLVRRYSKDALEMYPKFQSIKREKIDSLIQFFLDHLYPKYEERLVLDRAFDSLAGFVNNPSKIWGILGNLAMSIFRFGKHFPIALKAGLSALHSYITAHQFEESLVSELSNSLNPDEILNTPEGMERLIAKIPKEKADAFRKDIGSLFKIFSDEELVKKIILIMEDILVRMAGKTSVYTEDDKRGIGLGIQILKEGRDIFDHLSKEEINLILQAIDEIERDFYLKACERYSK
ncbi:MAG: hypothetical protein O9301_02320 [Leptospira sp.]|nr:hypothetical protein [Leptospira sp.]